jgi:hypothetical protein
MAITNKRFRTHDTQVVCIVDDDDYDGDSDTTLLLPLHCFRSSTLFFHSDIKHFLCAVVSYQFFNLIFFRLPFCRAVVCLPRLHVYIKKNYFSFELKADWHVPRVCTRLKNDQKIVLA